VVFTLSWFFLKILSPKTNKKIQINHIEAIMTASF